MKTEDTKRLEALSIRICKSQKGLLIRLAYLCVSESGNDAQMSPDGLHMPRMRCYARVQRLTDAVRQNCLDTHKYEDDRLARACRSRRIFQNRHYQTTTQASDINPSSYVSESTRVAQESSIADQP